MGQSAVHADAFDAEPLITPILTVGPNFRRWAKEAASDSQIAKKIKAAMLRPHQHGRPQAPLRRGFFMTPALTPTAADRSEFDSPAAP